MYWYLAALWTAVLINICPSAAAEPTTVSFARDIAPLLADHCVACHNSRVTKGHLNLDGYAPLRAGGDSGAAVVAGQPEHSPLWLRVADDSMPEGGEPLSAESRAMMKQWIASGAALDDGVPAEARLSVVRPTQARPEAPLNYAHPVPILALTFDATGERLFSTGYREVLAWNAQTGQLLARYGPLLDRVHDLTFVPVRGTVVAVGGNAGERGEVVELSLDAHQPARVLLQADDDFYAVSAAHNVDLVAVGGADRTLRLIELGTGTTLWSNEAHADFILDVAFDASGAAIATSSRDRTARVFDAFNGRQLASFADHEQAVTSVTFLGDSATLASSGRDHRLRFWRVGQEKEIRSQRSTSRETVDLLFAEGRVVLPGDDGSARWVSPDDGEVTRKIGKRSVRIGAVAWHPATRRVALGADDGGIEVWDVATNRLQLTFSGVPQTTATVAP